MDRVQGEPSHTALVDTWIKRSVEHSSSFDLVGLFGAALEALWHRAATTLGSVTLTAIAERVLGNAVGRYPYLSAINPRPNGDARWRRLLHERLALTPRSELLEGLRFALIELLTVIGRLTAEILSADLHAAIMSVTASASIAPSAPDAKPPADGRAALTTGNGKVQP
jgi:hypothetical protein